MRKTACPVVWERWRAQSRHPDPIGNWANPKAESDEAYFLDEGIRLHNGTSKRPEGMNAIDGINTLRKTLSKPASSIRLAGLSGVGKTRLLQALFDSRIGNNPLPDSQVCYTDMGHSPNPAPIAFAEQLRTLKKPIILAVDNCPPELHKNLTSICTAKGSLISLITVEYDVREDQPEETEVFRLEPASVELVEKIIQIRFKYISQTDSRTIAEFSGGNARIAIALANTVAIGETLAALKDAELFKRLFHQRHDSNDTLLKSAEVCALVYSFNCQTAEGSNTELTILASLANTTVDNLFSGVAELKRRDLVQQRHIWRAVLPHALANRLAQQALENIPTDRILNVFEHNGSERLLQSFSKRLSFLHESEQAIAIAKFCLSKQGLLKNVSNLTNLGINLLKNIAPVVPESTLEAIERAANGANGECFTSRDNPHYVEFSRLLRSLAYDAELFERCAALLCRFALSEKPRENHNSTRDLLKSLFFIYLSGTHASANQRLVIIESLVHARSEPEQELGLLLLESALQARHFNSHFNFEFGARSRDYGFSPKNREETRQWFTRFINLATQLAISEQPIAITTKSLIAKMLNGLWMRSYAWDALETMVNTISNKTIWNDGWVAVKKIIKSNADKMEPDLLARLQALEALLKPTELLEQARTYIFSDYQCLLDVEASAEDDKREEQLEQRRVQIGKEVATNEPVFNILLPELVSVSSSGLLSFTKGLVEGYIDPVLLWEKFRSQLSTVPISQQKYDVLCCILNSIAITNPEIASQILDEAVSDEILGVCFPQLQMSLEIDERGAERLKLCLNNGIAPIWPFINLANGSRHKSISDINLHDLLLLLAIQPNGLVIAVNILYMRLWGNKSEKCAVSNTLTSLGQKLLVRASFNYEVDRIDLFDYHLAQLVEYCLVGEIAYPQAVEICHLFAKAISEHKIHSWYYQTLLTNLAKYQPQAYLDKFYGDFEAPTIYLSFDNDNPKPLSHIKDETIIAWCEIDPSVRYPKIAKSMVVSQQNELTNTLNWSPLFLVIIENAPDVVAVLNAIKESFVPSAWEGSRADIMDKGLLLISQLKSHQNPNISEWACNEEKRFAEEIKQERQHEERWNHTQYERFE